MRGKAEILRTCTQTHFISAKSGFFRLLKICLSIIFGAFPRFACRAPYSKKSKNERGRGVECSTSKTRDNA